MANRDDRKIVSNVRQGGETYGPGREDKLAGVLGQERLDELVESGALSGTWKAAGGQAETTEEGEGVKSSSRKSAKK